MVVVAPGEPGTPVISGRLAELVGRSLCATPLGLVTCLANAGMVISSPTPKNTKTVMKNDFVLICFLLAGWFVGWAAPQVVARPFQNP
jgi:hypothetical protein